jgi:N-acylglucosamine 2-epimerase
MITVNLALELGSAMPDYPVEDVVSRNTRLVMEKFINSTSGLVYEHIDPDGGHPDTFEGRLINPGHGIECMWFIMSAAERTGDNELIAKAADTVERILSFGWDEKYGGIFYFLDALGKPPQQLEWNQKLWWVHIEALIALLLGWRHTRRPSLARWYERVHEYTWSHFPDPEHGEWFGYLNRRGEILLPLKGGKWKGCFHIPRGMLLCTQILDRIIGD